MVLVYKEEVAMLQKFNAQLKKISNNPRIVLNINPADHNVSLLKHALKQDFNLLYEFRADCITSELALAAVSVNARSIGYFPKGVLTEKICSLASEKYSEALKYIPQDFLDDEIIYASLSRWGSAIKYIPHEFINDLVLDAAIEGGVSLKDIPSKYVTRRTCEKILAVDGSNLVHVPKDLLSRDLILLGVKKTPMAVVKVDPEFIDNDIIFDALYRLGRCLEFLEKLDRKLWSDELLLCASIKDASVINLLSADDVKRISNLYSSKYNQHHPQIPSSLTSALKALNNRSSYASVDWAGKYLASHYTADEVIASFKKKDITNECLIRLAQYFDHADLAASLAGNFSAKRRLLNKDMEI